MRRQERSKRSLSCNKMLRIWLPSFAVAAISSLSLSTAAWQSFAAHFIDVGQSDSCRLHLPNSDGVLIDGGLTGAGSTVVAYLADHGATDIELMVATNHYSDHVALTPGWFPPRVTPGRPPRRPSGTPRCSSHSYHEARAIPIGDCDAEGRRCWPPHPCD